MLSHNCKNLIPYRRNMIKTVKYETEDEEKKLIWRFLIAIIIHISFYCLWLWVCALPFLYLIFFLNISNRIEENRFFSLISFVFLCAAVVVVVRLISFAHASYFSEFFFSSTFWMLFTRFSWPEVHVVQFII